MAGISNLLKCYYNNFHDNTPTLIHKRAECICGWIIFNYAGLQMKSFLEKVIRTYRSTFMFIFLKADHFRRLQN